MAYCPTCGQEVGETQRFCANCGTKLMGAHAAVPDPQGPLGGGVVEGEGFHWNAGGQAEPGLEEVPGPVDADLEPDDFFASYRRKGFEGDDDAPPLPRRSRRRFDPD
ncbi:MAG: zinc ribbon domain-containing protein, partial [Pseudoclavibacter sp.]|nr:zinc ribbon domain-containing protein [Pseudoclavibacter sp.]